jgi:hypothetical protein
VNCSWIFFFWFEGAKNTFIANIPQAISWKLCTKSPKVVERQGQRADIFKSQQAIVMI